MIRDHYKVNTGSDYGFKGEEVESVDADVDPLIGILERVEHKYHYRAEEIGLYHPLNKGTVKIRNTGSVEMFSSEDTGVRVDPGGQTVNIFANHTKSHLYHSTEWISGRSKSYIKKDRSTKIGGKEIIEAEGDIIIKGKKGLHIQIDKDENVTIGGNSKVNILGDAHLQVSGNVNAKVEQHATIEVKKDLNVRAKGNIDMEADGYLRIDGKLLFIGSQVIQRDPR